ncbi:MAG: hypothetical protein K0S21_2517, partial [Rhizobiaceae bacterium]|nr:hypothetical protein [Rhizobiaceae bacterium]
LHEMAHRTQAPVLENIATTQRRKRGTSGEK